MKQLEELYAKLQSEQGELITDKGTIHAYIPVYSKIFAPLKDKPISILEVGIYRGSSLIMWNQYFTKAAKVVGFDISLSYLTEVLPTAPAKIFQCDATKQDQLEIAMQKVQDVFGDNQFDIIIDDGSHMLNDQVKTMVMMWKYLKVGGHYFIEDMAALEPSRHLFTAYPGCTIHDLRNIKGRHDDVIIQMEKVDGSQLSNNLL